MTLPEHFLFGMNAGLALGLHRRYGWKVPAIMGLAATSPDIDGLTILGGLALFDQAHRVWGHGLLSVGIISFILGSIDYRFDIITKISLFFAKRIKDVDAEKLELRDSFTIRGWTFWVGLCFFGTLTHLLGDIIVSGNADYPVWPVELFWPLSERGFVYPLLSWGDPVPSLILIAGGIAMLCQRKYTQITAAISLVALVAYAIVF